MMKASGRAAVILLAGFFLAGLFVLFGGVAQAAPGSAASSKSDSAGKQADAVKPSKQQRRHTSRHRDSTKTAQKSDDKADKKDAAATADEAKADNRDMPASSQMPPEVANANAQLAAAETPTAAAASAMTGRANDNVQAAADNTAAPNAESQVVPPDQLNDIDRALQRDNAPAPKAVIAATEAQPRPAPVMASSQQSSAWDLSSLIGKIFIGVGTLLTLASAARMFMA
jgi:cytoskeletal protein RodZ